MDTKKYIYFAKLNDTVNSHNLLIKAANIHSGLPLNELDVTRERGKKPYFYFHPELKFSVSHSGNIWICAFSEHEIGIDLQLHKGTKRFDAIAKKFFHFDEVELINRSEFAQKEFYRIWSRKEAVAKMFGYGIDYRFPGINTVNDNISFAEKNIYISEIALPISEEYSSFAAYSCKLEFDVIFV